MQSTGMLPLLSIILSLLMILPHAVVAAESDRVQAARIFLTSGNPEQATRSAEALLKKNGIKNDERQALLSLIADAQISLATHQHFEDVKPAIAAIDTLLHEFFAHPKAAEYRWQRAWLSWKSGNEKQAITTTREIISKDQQPEQLRRAWLLMMKVHLKQRHYAYARSDLLQYGLQAEQHSREQALGMAWMAIVDQHEDRVDPALANMDTVFSRWPDVITSEPTLYAAYIGLLHSHRQSSKTLKLSEDFIKRYITHESAAAGIRLIRADILSTQKQTIERAIREYAILADTQAETGIGLQAFIRKLMLDNRATVEREKLIPVMIALKKIAASHQLSTLEDEAMLDLARLWTRIKSADDNKTPALDAFARATNSTDPQIAASARSEGALWLKEKLQHLLDNKQWLPAVGAWRHYPQLQPATAEAQPLRLSMAHAMRMLMLFESSEQMLQDLYQHNKNTLRGQMVMVELAKLWLDQQQPDGIKNIMRWLNQHPYSIYRPELMLVVARMQINRKQTEQARQTLASIRSADVSVESRALFWRTQAEIASAAGEWHRAANHWHHFSSSPNASAAEGLQNQADALFNAAEYSAALKLYLSMPEDQRGVAWQYHSAVCQLRSGELKQAMDMLQTIINNKDSGRFAALARLALADAQASTLLGEKP